MSLELGGKNKKISYLNLQKSGREASNDEEEMCAVTLNFNTPFLAKQDDYLCAVSRFSVPLTQVPSIDAMAFEVRRHEQEITTDGSLAPIYSDQGEPETNSIGCVINGEEHDRCIVRLPKAFSFYQFLDNIQEALENTYVKATYSSVAIDAGNGTQLAVPPGNFNDNRAMPLSERIKMKITPDFRFQLMICNDGFDDQYVVQLSRGMFHMCQFQHSDSADFPDFVRHISQTFVGDPLVSAKYNFAGTFSNDYYIVVPGSSSSLALATINWANHGNSVGTVNGEELFIYNGSLSTAQYQEQERRWTVHTAHMSCADFNRCREIVFTSDMAVKSEGNTTGGYKRFLCDYQITDNTRFSYIINDDRTHNPYDRNNHFTSLSSTVTETLPSHRVYTSTNPSAGRWQELTLPSPLYELEVRARVRIWDYETSTYKLEDIPLPAGTQYSVKLVFVSKATYIDVDASITDRFHK